MSIRHVVKTVAVSGAAAMCATAFALTLGSGVAGADLTSGPTTLSTQDSVGTVTPGTPYSSGQSIDVNVAANTTMNAAALNGAGLSPSGNWYVLECTDPGGTTPPSAPNNCEAATVQIVSGHSATDGSMSLTGANAYTVEDLPNASLGSPTMVGKCDVAPNTCVLGIFSENPWSGPTANPAAFTTPHLFSAPFQVDVPSGDAGDTGVSPGDGTPEVPLAIGLPLAALAVFGGVTLRNRRRRQQQAA